MWQSSGQKVPKGTCPYPSQQTLILDRDVRFAPGLDGAPVSLGDGAHGDCQLDERAPLEKQHSAV